MANVKTYTLTLDAQELRDVIEAALVCECQNAEDARAMTFGTILREARERKGYDLEAQKLHCMNARLMRVVKRIQETEAKA